MSPHDVPSLLLRPMTRAGGAIPDAPLRVERVDPPHGSAGVFRDSNVLICFSHATEPQSVRPDTLTVCDGSGLVPARLLLSPDRHLVIWRPERLLAAGETHLLVVAGVCDAAGREVAPYASSFTPCDLAGDDLP